MKVQPHAPAAFPLGKNPRYKSNRSGPLGLLWTLWRRDKSVAAVRNPTAILARFDIVRALLLTINMSEDRVVG